MHGMVQHRAWTWRDLNRSENPEVSARKPALKFLMNFSSGASGKSSRSRMSVEGLHNFACVLLRRLPLPCTRTLTAPTSSRSRLITSRILLLFGAWRILPLILSDETSISARMPVRNSACSIFGKIHQWFFVADRHHADLLGGKPERKFPA